MEEFGSFYTLGVALALGLLIGMERGWKDREVEEGGRVAGIRTSALIGLLGGIFGLLTQQLGALVLAVAFAAVALVLSTAHVIACRRTGDLGITGLVAQLLAFSLGAMATLDHVVLATVAAVVTTVLLSVKPFLHRLLKQLERKELHATLKLLLISVVVLPLLPNQGYGPWDALNPYRIWWMVVLISGISYVGYFAMKTIGERKGVMATGLFGGLASSTAVTVNLSRLARQEKIAPNVLAAGVVAACATMFPRVLVVTSVVKTELMLSLLWPMLVMSLACYAAAAVLWRRGSRDDAGDAKLRNPFEIGPALLFAALLAGLMLLSRLLADAFGDTGVYVLAAASGVADVDAITLSLASMSEGAVSLRTAALGVLVAAFVNSLVKAGLSLGIGGREIGLRVGASILGVVIAGLLTWGLVS